MKRFFLPLLAVGALLASALPAMASSHSIVARAETKLLLQSAVGDFCAQKPGADCNELKKLSDALYGDPKVVTRADLNRIDRLKAIFAKHNVAQAQLITARTDLASAIDRAEQLTNHVFFLHKGQWEEFVNCDMPT